MVRPSIVIADDHELMAKGLATLLAPHYEVRGIVHSGSQLLAFLKATPVECVLLDLSMPEQSGLEVLPRLRREWPAMRVIIVTMHVDRVLAAATMSLGAHGYVPKDSDLSELLAAMATVLSGQQFMSPRVPKHTDRTSLAARHPSLASLTPRQERILLMLGEGLSSAAIAQEFGLTESTIAFHRANIRRKLGIDTALGLHQFAVLIHSSLARTADP